MIRDYSAEVKRLFQTALPYFDGFWEYSPDWLKKSAFWQTEAKKVLEEDSFGWAFKSICIYDALSMLQDGDIVLWIDSNDILIDNPQPIFDFAEEYGIYSHDHYPTYYPNSNWTQKDMFVGMNCDEEKYWRTPQLQVNIMAFCKNDFVFGFVSEWVKYSTDYDTMIQNILPNMPGFQDHRHEQSIFTILMRKYDVPITRGYPYSIAHEELGIDARKNTK